MLVGIVSCRIAFFWAIWRDPEMLLSEACTFHNARFWMRERQCIIARHQLITNRLTQAVQAIGIDHFPIASGEGVNDLLGLAFLLEHGRLRIESIAIWVIGSQRLRFRVDFTDGVLQTVDHCIQAQTENMLMDRCRQLWSNQLTISRLFPWGDSTSTHDTRQLGLKLDRTILIKIPEEAILVVVNSCNEGNNQAT